MFAGAVAELDVEKDVGMEGIDEGVAYGLGRTEAMVKLALVVDVLKEHIAQLAAVFVAHVVVVVDVTDIRLCIALYQIAVVLLGGLAGRLVATATDNQ